MTNCLIKFHTNVNIFSGQDKHMAVIDISGQGVNKCDTVKLRVKNQIVDKLSPVNVKLTYDIKETPKRLLKVLIIAHFIYEILN